MTKEYSALEYSALLKRARKARKDMARCTDEMDMALALIVACLERDVFLSRKGKRRVVRV